MRQMQSLEEISIAIREFGKSAIDARQIWRRLNALLPTRLKSIQQNLPQNLDTQPLKQRRLLRAIASDDYAKHIEELVEVSANARKHRILYETHLMLLEARRSSRKRS